MSIKTVVLLLVLSAFLSAQEIDSKKSIEGKWLNQKKNRVVEIFKSGEKLFGKIVMVLEDEKMIKKDGEIILKDFEKDDEIYEGELYIPQKNKSLDCELELKNKNTLELNISVFMMSRTIEWTRYQENINNEE